MLVQQIDTLLNRLKMAQFCQAVFAQTFEFSEAILDLGEVVEKQLLKSLELTHIQPLKEALEAGLVAHNGFEIEVFLDIIFDQGRADVDVVILFAGYGLLE